MSKNNPAKVFFAGHNLLISHFYDLGCQPWHVVGEIHHGRCFDLKP